jgi:hypothetical protein
MFINNSLSGTAVIATGEPTYYISFFSSNNNKDQWHINDATADTMINIHLV